MEKLLRGYAVFHRNPKNRALHFIGVPTVMYSILIPLSAISPFGFSLTLAQILLLLLVGYYLSVSIPLASGLIPVLGILDYAANLTVASGTTVAVLAFTGATVAGWAIQLSGHRIEGNRPAFLLNIKQTIVAPLFLMAEVFFAFGWRPALRAEIHR